MSLKKIIRSLWSPPTIKIVSLIFIIGFFFVHPAFAQSTNTSNATLKPIQDFLATIIGLCSRGWVILAILAGKLMTNDFVYGSFLHMDVYLWKIRNIMKNFANFTLVALVLGSIIKSLFGKENIDVKKIITNTLLAGILIQASRFLMGALIDISTVATAAISSFPTTYLQGDSALQGKIQSSINDFKANRTVIDLNATGNQIQSIPSTNTLPDNTDLWKSALPTYNSISGPFIYLGMGVFQYQTYLTHINTANSAVTFTLEFALQFFLIFFFTVGLLLLFVANIMRIGFLRVFIIGAPFLVLLLIFKPKVGDSKMLKMFSMSNLIAIVFKPVIFVAGISLMLIIVVSMQKIMEASTTQLTNNLNGIEFGQNISGSTMSVPGISNVTINQQDLLGGSIAAGQNTFAVLIELLMTLLLVRWMIKLSLTIGGGEIEKTMTKLTGQIEQFAKSAPLLPVGGGMSFNAVKGVSKEETKNLVEGMGINEQGEFGQRVGKDFQTNETVFQDRMNIAMGLPQAWTNKDYTDLGTLASKDIQGFFTKSQELAKERQGGLTPGNASWLEVLHKALSDPKKATDLGFASAWDSGVPAEDYFKNTKNVGALYTHLGGFPASKKTLDANTTWDTIKDVPFHATAQ